MTPVRSLKSRALQWLAQREHSRMELHRKLLTHALAEAAPIDDAPFGASRSRAGAEVRAAAAERVQALLDWLEANHHLCDERFAESRVHARASRFGNLRIRSELKQHAVALTADAADALKNSELARAQSVCERRFAGVEPTPAARARQARFLAGRGFSPDTIRRVLRGTVQPGKPDAP